MADFRDHLYQRVSKRVNRSFWQFWVKIWDLVLPGDPQPCGLENGDIDLRFPWIFHFLVHRWGHKRRAGDFVWNSSEKDDLKFRHLFLCQLKHLETSWKIFVYHVFFHVCPTFIALVAGSHAAPGPGRFWSWYFGMLPCVAMRWPDETWNWYKLMKV